MRRVIAALAVVVLVLIAIGMVALTTIGGSAGRHASDASTTSSPRSTASTTSTTAAVNEVDRIVADVEAFVSKTRRLAYKRPVPVTLLSGAAFTSRLLEGSEDNRKQIALAQRSLRAVGLIDAKVDLYAIAKRFISDAVVGFYDAKHRELVVRGGTLTPYARVVLAHELTHALDDQWFGIERPDLEKPGNDEAAAAFTALVEGNAVRVQNAYESQLSSAAQLEATLEEQRAAASVDLKGVPYVVQEIISWPYAVGPAFVQALVEAGGEQRVDDALKEPPTTTEEIVDPAGYLSHRRVVAVALPKADGPVLASGLYGWSSLVETIEPVVGTDEAKVAANGWAGDAYVLWDAGSGRSCVRATFVMRTAADLAQLSRSLDTWAADRHAVVAHGGNDVSFTSCG